MNEAQFARGITAALDNGLRQIDPDTSSRLRAMRHPA